PIQRIGGDIESRGGREEWWPGKGPEDRGRLGGGCAQGGGLSARGQAGVNGHVHPYSESHGGRYHRVIENKSTRAGPADTLCEAPLEGIRRHVDAVGYPFEIGVIRVRGFAPQVPSVVVDVGPEHVPGFQKLIEERPVPVKDEIDLPVRSADLGVEARE